MIGIAEIAAFCSILEFAARVIQFGNRQVQNILLESSARIQGDQSVRTAEQARNVLWSMLNQRLGEQRSRVVFSYIDTISMVVGPTLEKAGMSTSNPYTILPHALLMDTLIREVTQKFVNWHCFELFGEVFVHGTYQRQHIPMPNTARSIVDARLVLQPGSRLKTADLHYDVTPIEEGQMKTHTIVATIIYKRYDRWQDDKRYLYFLDTSLVAVCNHPTHPSHHPNDTQPLRFEQFQKLFIGLLTDFSMYAEKVSSEAAQGKSFIDRIRGLVKR